MPLKNTPEVNEQLRHIKHLLDIKPLTFVHGIPEHPSDYKHADLRPSGNLYIKKRLENVPEATGLEPHYAPNEIRRSTWQSNLNKQRQSFMIHAEYFGADYVYEKNQDGKEYRYAKYGYAKKKDW